MSSYQWGWLKCHLLLFYFAKEENYIVPLSSVSPNFPLSCFYDYKYLLRFFHYRFTYTLKWYLFHLPVLSLPVCPF